MRYLSEYFSKDGGFPVQLKSAILLLLTFFIPIVKPVIPVLIVLFIIVSMFVVPFSVRSQQFRKNLFLIIGLTGFYLIYLLSLLFSRNTSEGLFNLEVKLTLFLFPLLFLTEQRQSRHKSNFLLHTFITGSFVATLICLGNSIFMFAQSNDFTAFTYSNLSVLIHTTYFAMYLNFALILALYFLIYTKKNSHRFIYSVVCFWFLLFIILLSSKMVYISTLLSLIIMFIYWGYVSGKMKVLLVAVVFFIAGLTVSVSFIPFINQRITSFIGVIENLLNNSYNDYDTTMARLDAWKCSLHILRANPVQGVGCGDVSDELYKEYSRLNLEELMHKRTNSHNQFLQTGIATGIIGIIFLLIMLLSPLLYKKSMKNIVQILFIIIVFTNLLTESMFETQAGVIFFAFFQSILVRNTMKSND